MSFSYMNRQKVGVSSSSRLSRRQSRRERGQNRREGDVLLVARQVLNREGITGFSMELVALEAGYSRGAIYQYFPSKEELIIALALETAELRLKLWERAQQFEAKPRERLMALGEVTAILYPRHVLPEVIAFANVVRMKTSEGRRRRLRDLEELDYRLAADVVRDAIAAGDLALPPGMTVERLVFGLMSFVRGMFASIVSTVTIEEFGIGDPILPMRVLGARLLDGLDWRPLSDDWDYRGTMRRIYSDLFPPTFLASLGLLADHRPSLATRRTADGLAGPAKNTKRRSR